MVTLYASFYHIFSNIFLLNIRVCMKKWWGISDIRENRNELEQAVKTEASLSRVGHLQSMFMWLQICWEGTPGNRYELTMQYTKEANEIILQSHTKSHTACFAVNWKGNMKSMQFWRGKASDFFVSQRKTIYCYCSRHFFMYSWLLSHDMK